MNPKSWLSEAAVLQCTTSKSRELLSFSAAGEIYGELINAKKPLAAACNLFSMYLKHFLYEDRGVLLACSYPTAASRDLQAPQPTYTAPLQLQRKKTAVVNTNKQFIYNICISLTEVPVSGKLQKHI